MLRHGSSSHLDRPLSLHHRPRRGISSLGAVAVLVGLALHAPAAWAAPSADQSSMSSGPATRAWGVDSTQWMGQTFTPSVTDVLGEVSILMYQWLGSGQVTMSIYDTASGLPTGSSLASAAVPALPAGSSVSDCASISPTLVTFTSPAHLTAGHQYAFTLETSSAGLEANTCSNATTYGAGAAITASPSPTWLLFSSWQLLFTTYMGAVPVTPSSSSEMLTVHQALPMPASGDCGDVADAAVAYGTGLHGGWQKGWQPWVPSSDPAVHGGWACERALVNQGGQTWSVNNSYS